MAMDSVFFPARLIIEMSISNPTRKRKYMRPMFAIVSITITLFKGNIALANLSFLPNTDGPNNNPPYKYYQIIPPSYKIFESNKINAMQY
nr:hypothetical protein KK1_038765 [Cajanus cajan]